MKYFYFFISFRIVEGINVKVCREEVIVIR